MASNGSASFERHFQVLPDPRILRARKHPPINIVFMAVCGVLSGSDSIAGIHEFAVDRRNWFARYLDLSAGVPCEDTFARVLARIVGNGLRGYHFFGEVGTSPKLLRFGQVVPDRAAWKSGRSALSWK
jgi:hypothetical protein